MERSKCRSLCVEIFNNFNAELMGRPDYEVHLNSKDEVVLDKFLDYVDEIYELNHVGVGFFINYCESCFNYYYKNPKARGLKRKIFFNWIFGKKSIERYEKYGKKYRKKSREIAFISGISIIKKYEDDGFRKLFRNQCKEINESEERNKKLYHNTINGYVFCSMNTTMYNHRSDLCVTCNYIQNCKENLKKNFPKLYNIRNYGK